MKGHSVDLNGQCYCGALRYNIQGDPMLKAQCHCRECQYITGGGPNYFMMLPAAGHSYTRGTPRQFARPDLETPVTREFCPTCGTHVLTRVRNGDNVVIKVGTLDDPSAFGGPTMAIYTCDAQPFHQIPAGLATFDRLPKG